MHPDATSREEALIVLAGDGFRVEDASVQRRFAKVDVRASDGRVSRVGGCARAQLRPGTALWGLDLAPLSRVRVTSSVPIDARLFLGHAGGPARELYPELEANVAKDILIPDVGDRRLWYLGLDSPAVPAVVGVCFIAPAGETRARAPLVEVRDWD